MSLRIRCVALLPRPCSVFKTYSTLTENVTYSNFKKLRAFPFIMSPEKARQDMSRAASLFCYSGNIWACIKAIFFKRDLPSPTRFAAVYFPAWVVNAEAEADVTFNDTRVIRRGSVILRNSYMPGSHMSTLSAAPLWGPELEGRVGEGPLPFEESMLKQQGLEIQCIPFTTSPFAVFDVGRHLSWSNAVIDKDFKFSPSTLKVNMFSAYPVLLPLYLAAYDFKRDGGSIETVTTWIQPHLEWPNVMVENCLHKLERSWVRGLTSVLDHADSEVLSLLAPFQQVTVEMLSFPVAKKASAAIQEWLQRSLKSSSNISYLASKIESDSDPRIRPMTKDEISELDAYFQVERKILVARRAMVDLENAGPTAKVFAVGLGAQTSFHTTPEAASIMLEGRLKELNAIKEKVTPVWWSEWKLSENFSS